MSPQRLEIYVADLADLSRDQLKLAFTRARRECRFFPKIAELRELVGCNPKEEQDAEWRKAWDIVTSFANKWVQSDVNGNYVISRGVRSSDPPKLSQRILDTVRRTGGWRAYKCLRNDDFPFQQKRFLEEYAAWVAVEQIEPSRLLTELPRLQLVAKPIDSAKNEPSSCLPRQAETVAAKPRPTPTPMTDAQIRDRREALRQQAASHAKGTRSKCERP